MAAKLIAKSVPLDTAFQLADWSIRDYEAIHGELPPQLVGAALCIRFGMQDGGKWSWENMSWIDENP